jgi:hypothetical protein
MAVFPATTVFPAAESDFCPEAEPVVDTAGVGVGLGDGAEALFRIGVGVGVWANANTAVRLENTNINLIRIEMLFEPRCNVFIESLLIGSLCVPLRKQDEPHVSMASLSNTIQH